MCMPVHADACYFMYGNLPVLFICKPPCIQAHIVRLHLPGRLDLLLRSSTRLSCNMWLFQTACLVGQITTLNLDSFAATKREKYHNIFETGPTEQGSDCWGDGYRG